ncbi:putative Sugar phosphate isomerases/epimerase [Vibrio nigripulchritudo MADA3029]|uniref:sugar phosphate isomerase/epimerase family protein n=1 Tax=Vibrio nigripulchritudo TaxID=28173 RepID=UPI0003B1B783|nr:sugar phosphate isomerase/epimerase family protein [Vibrio nigripulchritudo]CCN46594.1 putative Sugar phosphate isomerases/epimerase [Vibrio nigripulchritudo MADA3020]CCN54629.1 putative Sugar phosphate isomerases/epimerase [Vibrio nigripulchritudo MADA3021]CCN59453.1 putative Sugar phosphate isomerases/epimerase [Vibrio nigripulchritudo MADA3029]
MRDFSSSTQALALNTATLGHNVPGKGFGWSTEALIDNCAELGFSGITFWRQEFSQHQNLDSVGRAVRGAGMSVSGLCRSPFFCGPFAPDVQQVKDDFKLAIDQTAELQAECLVILTGGVPIGMKGITAGWGLIESLLAEASEYAAQSGVKLALEPLHPMYGGDRSCIVTVKDALTICENVGARNLGIAVDVYHVWWDSQLETSLKGTDKVFSFHLCDWLAETKDLLLDRGMMGDGVADIPEIRRIVEDVAGYQGLCEIEIFSEYWWSQHPRKVLETCVERFKGC